MRAAKYLGRIRWLDMRISICQVEKERVMDLATRITPSMSDMPPGGGGVSDRIGNAAAKLADLEREIVANIDQLIDDRRVILDFLDTLQSLGYTTPAEYTVLVMYFVQCRTVEDIAEKFKPRPKSPRQISRIKASALKSAQAFLDDPTAWPAGFELVDWRARER